MMYKKTKIIHTTSNFNTVKVIQDFIGIYCSLKSLEIPIEFI